MNELLTAAIAAGSSLAAAIITWIFSRRKNNAEVKGTELDNVNKAVEIWRETAEALEKTLSDYMQKMKEMNQLNENLKCKLDEIEVEVKNLQIENGKLKELVDKLTKRCDDNNV